jgi:hypothetical protein
MNSRAGISLFEFLLIAGTLALAAAMLVPSVAQVRDAVAVERTARLLEALNAIAKTNALLVARGGDSSAGIASVAGGWPWPEQVQRDSFEYDSTNGVSVALELTFNARRVKADDAAEQK